MATTGELRTIIEELELEDVGDAASYLGEEGNSDIEQVEEDLSSVDSQSLLLLREHSSLLRDIAHQLA
jgi:uncharacterized protein CbrC (UPF0167 family)